jgi:hypothetical protein
MGFQDISSFLGFGIDQDGHLSFLPHSVDLLRCVSEFRTYPLYLFLTLINSLTERDPSPHRKRLGNL